MNMNMKKVIKEKLYSTLERKFNQADMHVELSVRNGVSIT